MGKGVQKTHNRLPWLKVSGFLFLYFQSFCAFSLTTSMQFSLGMTSYNNSFFLKDNAEGKNIKFIPQNIFSPIFKISADIYFFKKWRVGIEGAFRTKIDFETKKTTLAEEQEFKLSSSLATSSLEFHVLYQVVLDFKHQAYFGLSAGYAEHFLGSWKSSLYSSKGEFEQILAAQHHPVFIGKLIAGRDFALPWDLYLDLSIHFSFLEITSTSDKVAHNTLREDHVGVWSLKAPYSFPSSPLDLTLGIRKNFSF